MAKTPVSVSLNSASTQKKIIWNISPIVAPLFLSKLTVIYNSGVQTNSVVGEIHPGTSPTSPGQCTLYAGYNKFQALLNDCSVVLSESLTYDDSFEVCDVGPTTVIHAALAREFTLERVVDRSDSLLKELIAMHKTNRDILSALKSVGDRLPKAEHESLSHHPEEYSHNEEPGHKQEWEHSPSDIAPKKTGT